MQHDEIIWQTINNGFCSFKSKLARERTFCQNPYNVTGLCLRSACPLANSQYATIREEDGRCYLYLKTIERAHSPKNLWEKITLPANYTAALEQVSQLLEHFPKYLVHRNKQRLTKIHQMLIRMRRLQLKERPKIETINTKIEKREKGRERKALRAAQLDRAIEKELLDRLQAVSEDVIYNYPERQFNRVLNKSSQKTSDKEEGEEEEEEEEELEEEGAEEAWEDLEEEDDNERPKGKRPRASRQEEEEEEEEEEEAEPADYEVQYVEDFEESDAEDDLEDVGNHFAPTTSSFYSKSSSSALAAGGNKKKGPLSSKTTGSNRDGKKKPRRGAHIEIEYEEETTPAEREAAQGDMDFNF
eukprot:scaffold3412_cov171-Ochromonas_danica.AAC.7